MSITRSVLVLACMVAAVPTFASNIVNDPSFEGNSATWNTQKWDFSMSNGGVFPHTGTWFMNTGCQSAACIQANPDPNGAWVFQDLTTDIGSTYTFSFWYDLGSSIGSVGNDTSQVQALWGSDVVFDVTVQGKADAGYQFFTGDFLATATTTTIQFLGRNDPDQIGIDDVDVELQGVAPEPSTIGLIGLGLAGLAVIRRRR